MDNLQQEIIAILKAARSVFQRILTLENYQPNEEEWLHIYRFREVWEAGLDLESGYLEEAGIKFDEVGFFIGYSGYNEPPKLQKAAQVEATTIFRNKPDSE